MSTGFGPGWRGGLRTEPSSAPAASITIFAGRAHGGFRCPAFPVRHEFMAAYADALAAAPVAIGKTFRSRPGSISSAIAMYYSSQDFRSLQGGTPALRRAILEKFREQYGNRTLMTLPRESSQHCSMPCQRMSHATGS